MGARALRAARVERAPGGSGAHPELRERPGKRGASLLGIFGGVIVRAWRVGDGHSRARERTRLACAHIRDSGHLAHAGRWAVQTSRPCSTRCT